jgi:hypothetical protein
MQTELFKSVVDEMKRQLPLVIGWNRLPISRSALADIYPGLLDDALLFRGYDLFKNIGDNFHVWFFGFFVRQLCSRF